MPSAYAEKPEENAACEDIGCLMAELAKRPQAAMAAEQVTRKLVGRTVAEVERDLILETLKHCLGNRTNAANILGISIRTLRNKLNEYAADGSPISPANGGGDPLHPDAAVPGARRRRWRAHFHHRHAQQAGGRDQGQEGEG